MLPVSYIRDFIVWAWRCGRGWIEMGHRVQALEAEVAEQARVRRAADDELRVAIGESESSARDSRDRLHRRIDDMDRAQQDRIDAWAQQLSSQINQVLLAVASRPGRDGHVD